MALKRSLESIQPGSPAKKRHISYSKPPQTPFASCSGTWPSTPKTPYPLYPSDSPTNPFGRKHIQRLSYTLPPATSFSRHLALRFQFVRRGVSPRQGGIYRVVQVPLSYTFVHLRCLIAYLFNGARQIGNDIDEHWFEIKRDTTMFSPLYKPGEIKTGQTWAKLSTVKDPCRYNFEQRLEDDEEEDELENEGSESIPSDSEDWQWEDEGETKLGHAWPAGIDLDRGIIYHHNRTVQVHITLNRSPIPRRRGKSNTPFIFNARGRVWLSPPLPQPIFSVLPESNPRGSKLISSPMKPKSTLRDWDTEENHKLSDKDADGDTDSDSCSESGVAFTSSHPFHVEGDDSDVGDAEEGEDDNDNDDVEPITEDHSVELNSKRWNGPTGFARFLAQYMGVKFSPDRSPSPGSDDCADENEDTLDDIAPSSTPGLTHSSRSSSPFASSSPQTDHGLGNTPFKSTFDISSYPILKYKYTPAPPKANRIRIARVEKRMDLMKKGDWACVRDESVSEEEKDELDEESVMPVLKEGEIWDPFGDELEV